MLLQSCNFEIKVLLEILFNHKACVGLLMNAVAYTGIKVGNIQISPGNQSQAEKELLGTVGTPA